MLAEITAELGPGQYSMAQPQQMHHPGQASNGTRAAQAQQQAQHPQPNRTGPARTHSGGNAAQLSTGNMYVPQAHNAPSGGQGAYYGNGASAGMGAVNMAHTNNSAMGPGYSMYQQQQQQAPSVGASGRGSVVGAAHASFSGTEFGASNNKGVGNNSMDTLPAQYYYGGSAGAAGVGSQSVLEEIPLSVLQEVLVTDQDHGQQRPPLPYSTKYQ